MSNAFILISKILLHLLGISKYLIVRTALNKVDPFLLDKKFIHDIERDSEVITKFIKGLEEK